MIIALPPSMVVTRIIQLADGEELVSFENGERTRSASLLEDPRRGAIERRQLAEKAQELN